MGKIIKNGVEYSSTVPDLTKILHTELDAYTAEFDEKLATKSATYTTLEELGLTADATVDDVYGALKDGETAILDTSEFTNQLTMFPNFCTNDQYAILQVEKKNGSRAFIEWRQKDGNAYAIAGLNSNNQFTNWGNIVRFKKDGYADDSIIAIGDAVSSDGVIQTLANLGFTGDVMTWDTGVYRVSHVEGLTNLPTDITSTAPGFRLEHHDIKKWGSNHNPNKSTWALRHSILYAENGNVYSRYTESGATAGVYTKDTGWRCIAQNTKALVTNAQNFKLDITKNNSAWYGMFTFNFVYGTTPCEITVTITDTVYYTVTKGQNIVSAITYTQSDANYQIGIDFTTKIYGTQVVEMPSEFGTINSLTGETFSGATTAILKGYDGRAYNTLEELGLTADATLNDVIAKLGAGQTATLTTTYFTNYQTLFPYEEESDSYATVRIEKGYDHYGSRTIVTWVRKDASKVAYGGLDNNNKVAWWNEYALKEKFNGKSVKTVTIDLSADDLQSTGTSSAWVSLGNYISQTTKVIRAEGYYNPPSDSTYPVVIPVVFGSQAGHLATDSTGYSFRAVQSPSGKKGSGFVKVYYVE